MRQGRVTHFKKSAILSAAAIVCALALASTANAQVQTTTSISGTVFDTSGGAIPNATVTVRNRRTGGERTTMTNSSGFYSLPSLLPGTYTITVKKSGFKTGVITGRVVDVAEPARVDVTLQVGATTQTVQVSGAGEGLINTTTAEISGTINQTLVSHLPLNRLDFMDLAALTPGSSRQDAMGNYTNNSSNQVSFAQGEMNRVQIAGSTITSGVFAGGNRDSAANVSIDGSNVQSATFGQTTQLQAISDVQEVKVESGIMNAEFGFGASAVNVITKGGSNAFHGSAYDYFRNNALDATDFFTNLARRSLPVYVTNQFGASFGGPIIKNKLHFFTDYQGLRIRQTTVATAFVPPAAVHAGDFSTIVFPSTTGPTPGPPIYNPYQSNPTTGLRTPFPNNQIPLGTTNVCAPRPTCMDPVAMKFLALTPVPNTVIDGIPEYVGTPRSYINSNQYTVRIDWDKDPRDRIFGRFTHYQNQGLAGGLMSLQGSANPYGSLNPTVSWTRTISPSAVNDLTLSYIRPNWGDQRNTAGIGNVSQQIGLTNTDNLPGSPGVNIPGFSLNQSSYALLHTTENNYQFKDDFSLVKGKHTMKFGLQSNERRLKYSIAASDKGQFNYQAIYTAACPLGSATCTSAMKGAGEQAGGLALADYLLGAPRNFYVSVEGTIDHRNLRYYGLYWQDSWQPLRKLTLNYGLRWEYWSPWLSPRRISALWDAQKGTVVYALQNPLDYLSPATHFGRDAPLTPGIPASGYTTGKHNFAPRLSLAYLVTPNTVVRAGAGIFFDGNGNGEQIQEVDEGVGPFGLHYEQTVSGNEATPPYLMANQFPSLSPTSIPEPSLTNPVSARVMAGKFYPTPTVYEWSFSVQRRLSQNWALDLSYLGTHTIHQQMFIDLNPANLPQGPLASLTLQQRRLIPTWGAIQTWANIGWAKYDAFTATLKSPQWKGLTLLSWFTWSKDKMTSSVGYSDNGNNDFRYYDIWAGPSLMNPNLRFSNAWSYELPVGKSRPVQVKGPLDWVVGDWTLSGTAEFWQGGHQWVIGTDTSGTGQTFASPNLVCNPNVVPGGQTRLEWLNTACYQNPPFGTFGTATIGSFIEPGINNWDLSLNKVFPIFESKQLQLRGDFFNAFNHTQWGYVVNQSNSRSFGKVGQTRPPRQIQLSLTFSF